MKPVIALVGRPNVGKSTLFNRLTGTRDALVDDVPGVTRDRLYGLARLDGRECWVVDTGGFVADDRDVLPTVREQVAAAVADCDVAVLTVDGRSGLVPGDREIVTMLRRSRRPVVVAVNKAEGIEPATAVAEFHSLGLGDPVAVSARHGHGIGALVTAVLSAAGEGSHDVELPDDVPRVAIVGRPNAGKSTLVNALVGESRVVVHEAPGTTRDSVRVPLHCPAGTFVLIDTAGVRRRSRVTEKLEKYSVVKTLRAIDDAHVVLLVIDAQQGLGEQDARLAGVILDAGRSMVVVLNKWDAVAREERELLERQLARKLPFVADTDVLHVSALQGTGLKRLLPAVRRAYESAMVTFNTTDLNRILHHATSSVAPPLVNGRQIKLKYAHQGGRMPPQVVIHGNLVRHVPESYRRYLARVFRQAHGLTGTRVSIDFRQGANPYANRPRRPRHDARRAR